MSVVKGYYNEELFGKAIGRDVSCPIECNMDEDNIEYYIGDNTYPNTISKEELKLKCNENKISYNVLININKANGTLEEIEIEMTKLYQDKYRYELYTPDNSLIDLSSLSLDEIEEEIESFTNCFENIKFKKFILYIHSIVYFKDHSGSILYNKDGSEAFYRVNKAYCIRKPNLDTYRNENELVLDLLLNKLFHNVIK